MVRFDWTIQFSCTQCFSEGNASDSGDTVSVSGVGTSNTGEYSVVLGEAFGQVASASFHVRGDDREDMTRCCRRLPFGHEHAECEKAKDKLHRRPMAYVEDGTACIPPAASMVERESGLFHEQERWHRPWHFSSLYQPTSRNIRIRLQPSSNTPSVYCAPGALSR